MTETRVEVGRRCTDAQQWLSRALNLARGETPFPWQSQLLGSFLRQEFFRHTPVRSIDLPTGLGKTAVMPVWLVAQARGAKLPRRLVYVVDRRAVVDQATDVALSLRELVDTDCKLKQSLRIPGGRSLPVSTLRGRYVDNREWLDDPAIPAIIVGTVDMVGSRLLFEGYGVSRKMRAYHAGLLGADALVVLDEAHLVPPFEHLLRTVATDLALHSRDQECRELVPPFRVLALSATGRMQRDDVVELTQEDLKHAVVKRRLHAKKSLCIEALDAATKLEDALARYAWKLADRGRKAVRILTYSDSRDVAWKAKEAVEKLAKGDTTQSNREVKIETELLVGARRVFERDFAKERLNRLGFIAGSTVERDGPVFLFSTSAGEVGVDLDADHMVGDLVAWERMVQRLGRVNRRGDGDAQVVVVVEPEPDNTDEMLTKDPSKRSRKEEATVERVLRTRAVAALIDRLPATNGGGRDVSPNALHRLRRAAEADPTLGRLVSEAITPEPLRPALTRPLVEAWAMTSLERHTGRPAIQPWLRGWTEDEPQTRMVWRTYLPARMGGTTPHGSEIERFFEAAPPHTSEILETETFRVLRWLAARARRVRAEQTQSDRTEKLCLRDDDVVAFAFDLDGGVQKAFKLGDLDPEDKREKDELQKLLEGVTLVLDARLAGLRDGLLDEREAQLPRTADDGQEWLGEGVVGFRVRSFDAFESVPREPNWRERFRFASDVTDEGEATRWLVVEKWRDDAATEDDRSAAKPQLLEEHESWTERRARRLAVAMGLDDAHAEVLALAARLHDEGKRAGRWQRAFHAHKGHVYAKTEGPINYSLLDGYRHELGSLLHAENDHEHEIQVLHEVHRDLVLHLIAAHHGCARPVIGTSGCEGAPPSVLEEKAVEIALRFARLQDRWGPWGLAWWEALLRAADQQASRDNDGRDGATGRE